MYEEPEESPQPRRFDPKERAQAKSDEFRMHAELAAVFEGPRKFDARILPGLDADIAREAQRTIGRLEKAKMPDTPVIKPQSTSLAAELLDLPNTKEISTNDYHIHRRPGEVMILRWLQGDEVDTYYTRLQAHFDAALTQYREDEHSTHGWKQDATMQAYLDALDKIQIKMEDRYLRPMIRQHKLHVLSTQAADEMDILHLADFIMGAPAAEVVGPGNAPPDEEPTEQDRAWFFKLFSLRGVKEDLEQMFFFTFLQKSDESAF
jgi:hypothetical protein